MSLPVSVPISSETLSDPRSALIELVYAGNALANLQLTNVGLPGRPLMICEACGYPVHTPTDPDEHGDLCPVGRYLRAVDAMTEVL